MDTSASVDLESVFLEIRRELDEWVGRRYHSTDLAADIVQDVYLRLHRVRRPLEARSDARAFLFRMASNAAIDHYRVEARRTVLLQSAAPLQENSEDGPEARLVVRDQLRVVREAMRELPKHCDKMLILSRVYGLTNGEIASAMDVSKSLVEKYIAMALDKARETLESLECSLSETNEYLARVRGHRSCAATPCSANEPDGNFAAIGLRCSAPPVVE